MNTAQDHLTRSIRDNFIAKISHPAGRTEGYTLKQTPAYIRADCGLPSDTFNVTVLLHTRLTPEDEAILEEAVHYFTDKKYPMALWSWEDKDSVTFETLRQASLKEAETNIAMYANLDALDPGTNCPADFRIKEITSREEAEQFGAVLASLFGESEEGVSVRAFYRKIAALPLEEQSPMKLYIGSYQGQPVSTGTLMFTDDSVGIYDIATLADFRGQSFGSAMFRFLIGEARKGKPRLCVLQASPDGIGIYKRAGFEPVCEVTVYENRHLIE
ncbi:GNAT family N-acetyltransferase [Paenibacillus sp. UNC499MF]|uniref:GNAT family N-acetyltransferase n=1 Tax=Paenibacillus sp. UNC499MF TaxID=1502751 RepID=UPI0008A04BD2|nr:GNAT family N-acetyltransferase [Paenibacillus sp. UNC499MF]SEG63958.1 Acetyltransferase (GNAT) domain-containing protein [Paenibacillus sp. UNC499MF]